MELKITKKSVRAQDLCINEQAQQPIDLEFSLPDYCGEIERIIKCSLNPAIAAVSCSADSVTADGEAVINVIYCTKDGMISGYETQVQFEKTADIGVSCDKAMINVTASADYINCRAVNERKLDVHGAVTVHFEGSTEKEEQIVCDSEDENLQLRKEKSENLQMCGCCSKHFSIDEEFDLPQSMESVKNVIRSNAFVEPSECKTVAGKALISGSVSVDVLYCNENGECESFSGSIPFEQMLDFSGGETPDECDFISQRASICSLKIKPHADINGDNRNLSASIRMSLEAVAYKSEEIEAVCDCFSVANELAVDKNMLTLRKLAQKVDISKQIRETLDFDENAVEKVIDVDCNLSQIGCNSSDEKSVLCGVLMCSIITQSTNDEYMCFDKNLPFEYEIDTPNIKNCKVNVTAYIKNCSYVIRSSSSIEITAQIEINGCITADKQVQFITGITADEDNPKMCEDMPAMMLYFADDGDCVWNIAMRYNTSPELIMKANGLESDIVSHRRILMIPGI